MQLDTGVLVALVCFHSVPAPEGQLARHVLKEEFALMAAAWRLTIPSGTVEARESPALSPRSVQVVSALALHPQGQIAVLNKLPALGIHSALMVTV